MKNIQNEILTILLETLKEQANKYKIIVQDSSLTHEQRKEFDTEISQMYKVLADMSASSTVYTIAELQALKVQYKTKLDEFETILNNIYTSNLTLTPEQIESLKGENGKDFKYEDLTEQQKSDLVSYFTDSQSFVNLNSKVTNIDNETKLYPSRFAVIDDKIDSLNLLINDLSSAYDSLNQRLINLENNQGNTTPTTPINQIDFKSEYTEFNSYLYQNTDLQLKPFYFLYNAVMFENDEIEIVLKNGDLEYYVSMKIIIQPIYGDYQLQIIDTNLPSSIGVEAYYKIVPNDSKFGFNLEFNDKDNNFNFIYPFNSFEIYIYRGVDTIRIDDLFVTDEKSIFYSIPTPPPIV